jgi:hypothetical protein
LKIARDKFWPNTEVRPCLGVTSTTQDPALAERSVSWRAGQAERLAWKLDGERFSCDLRYDAATSLPDGMLFVPAAMEDEWVIAWRQGKIAAARSWTGAVSAQGAEILRGVPLASFGPFGHRCFSAAIDYAAPKSKRPLRRDGP